MKNRLDNSTGRRKIENLDELLKDITSKQESILDDEDMKISEHFNLPISSDKSDAINDFQTIGVFKRHYLPMIKKRPTVDKVIALVTALDGLSEALKKDNAHQDLSAHLDILKAGLVLEMYEIAGGTRGFTDEQMAYREDLFNGLKALKTGDIFRRAYIETYIDEEVYNRFYLEKEKEAGRFDTENEGEKYTPAGAREWDGYYNALCQEYDTIEYRRDYTSPEEYYKDLRPEDGLYEKCSLKFMRGVYSDTGLLRYANDELKALVKSLAWGKNEKQD